MPEAKRNPTLISILVILAKDVNPVTEIKRNNTLISDLSLETDHLIQLYLSLRTTIGRSQPPLIQNIYKEGIAV